MVFTMTCPSRLESAASSEIYWSSGTNIVLLKPGNCKSRFFLFFYFIIFLAFIEYKNRSDYLFSLRIEKHWKERLNQASLNNQAPGMGFEPMRTLRSTGSQGPRVNHSAIPAPQVIILFRSLFKCLPNWTEKLSPIYVIFKHNGFDRWCLAK